MQDVEGIKRCAGGKIHLSYTQDLIVRTQCHPCRVKPEKHIVHVSGTKQAKPKRVNPLYWMENGLITGVRGNSRSHDDSRGVSGPGLELNTAARIYPRFFASSSLVTSEIDSHSLYRDDV